MKTLMRFFPATALCAITLIGPGAARAAHAQTVWSSIAAGCVLDSGSAALATTTAVGGTVSFADRNTDFIRLTCPVTAITPLRSGQRVNWLSVNYYDPDGRGGACQVRAFLLRGNLNQLERGWTITGFDSNTGYSWTEIGTGKTWGVAYIPEVLDFNTSYYFVDLELYRSDTSCNPTAVGVHLDTSLAVLER
jgi:hypothetical protein